MTDQPDWPGWTTPGDATDDGDPRREPSDGEGVEDAWTEPTRRLPTEPSQGQPNDPPPPPPPPIATQSAGWAPPPPPGAQPAHGAGGWQPPPTQRRTGLVVGLVIGAVVLLTIIGVGAVFVARTTTVTTTIEESDAVPGPDVEEERPGDRDVPADDLEAQAEAVLGTINDSEERMIEFQEVVFTSIGEDGTVGDAAAEIAGAAQDAGNDLTDLRSELRALAGGQDDGFDGLRDVRDTYAEHMDAWIDYLDEVAGSPALAAPDAAEAEPLWREIEVTGDDFVTAVETGLPDDLPRDLQDLAEFIVERGFGGFGDGPAGEVI